MICWLEVCQRWGRDGKGKTDELGRRTRRRKEMRRRVRKRCWERVDTRRGEKKVRDDGDDERCGIDEGSAEEKSNEKLRSRKTRIEKGRGARKIERRTRGR